MQETDFVALADEIIAGQRKKLLSLARRIVPDATEDDILQAMDFPELEYNADFRYEEGILEGLLVMKTAWLTQMRSIASVGSSCVK